jgi:hypothetical protein
MAILQLVIAPLALFTCGLSIYANIKSMWRRHREKQKIHELPLRMNYYVNKSHNQHLRKHQNNFNLLGT